MNWVFQANPKLYDLAAAIGGNSDRTWAMNQNRQFVSPGDRVYFWVSGSDARLLAVGRVTSPVYELEGSSFGKHAVDVAYEFRVEPPLRRDEIRSSQSTTLSAFRGFLGFMGTNYRITDERVVAELDNVLQDRLIPLSSSTDHATVNVNATTSQIDLDRAIKHIRQEVAGELRQYISTMDPTAFEWLIRALLIALGYREIVVTRPSNDGGIDLRAKLVAGGITNIETAIQVKRTSSVGRPVVQGLRGSLSAHETGLLVTSGRFTEGAEFEARDLTRASIALLNGRDLVNLLLKHQIGATERTYRSYMLDTNSLAIETLQARAES